MPLEVQPATPVDTLQYSPLVPKVFDRRGGTRKTSRLHINGVRVLTTPSTCSHAKRPPRAPAPELSKEAVFAGLQAVSRVGLRIAIASGREPHCAVSSTVLRKERGPVAQTWRRRNLRGGSSDTYFERAPHKPFTHARMRIS